MIAYLGARAGAGGGAGRHNKQDEKGVGNEPVPNFRKIRWRVPELTPRRLRIWLLRFQLWVWNPATILVPSYNGPPRSNPFPERRDTNVHPSGAEFQWSRQLHSGTTRDGYTRARQMASH